MNISVIIPNYNGEDLIKKNLPEVIKVISNYDKNNQIELIIVDDNSTDNSVAEINNVFWQFKDKIKNLKIVLNKKNLGFSSTINTGVKEAKGEVLILLNTDVIPSDNFINPLLEHFEDPNVFAVGCLDKSLEKSKIVLRGRGIGKLQKGFLIHKRGEINKKNTLWVSAGSGAFRKSIWMKLGGLNELYNPFYWEDIDLSYRALKSGYKVMFEEKSLVVHKHEEGVIKKQFANKIKIIAYRNQFIFFWLNITDLSLQFSHLLWLPYHFARALKAKDWNFFQGFFNALILSPKIIKSSFIVKNLFIKKDEDVIKEFIE